MRDPGTHDENLRNIYIYIYIYNVQNLVFNWYSVYSFSGKAKKRKTKPFGVTDRTFADINVVTLWYIIVFCLLVLTRIL